ESDASASFLRDSGESLRRLGTIPSPRSEGRLRGGGRLKGVLPREVGLDVVRRGIPSSVSILRRCRDGTAGPGVSTDEGSGWHVLGVSVPDRRPRLEASATGRP